MAEPSLLQTFRQSYQNTDLTPLVRPSQLEEFWVEYGRAALDEVEQLVEDNAAQDAKVIFSGHRGCGKSTLLAELGRNLDNRYFVSLFSISDTIEMSDVNHINILFAIGVNLMLKAAREQIAIPDTTRQGFDRWFAKRTRIEADTFSAEGSADFNVWDRISGKLKTESSVREEIRQEFEHNISELVAKLNEIAATVQIAADKDVLVVIDDLDKLDLGVVKQIFQDHIKALFLPGFSIIFTVPVSCLRDIKLLTTLKTEADDQIVVMPVSKLFGKGERRLAAAPGRENAIAILCEVLHKRIPLELLEPDVARQMVLQSGGVLRELIRISNRCCRICLRGIRRDPGLTEYKIDQAVLDEAIKELRLDFETTLGKADYSILQAVHEKFVPVDPKEQAFLDLLHGLHVLEYRNAEVWYDVHPIVTDLLVRKELIVSHD